MKRPSIIVAGLLVVTVLGLCVGGVQKFHDARKRTACSNTLKGMGLGLHAYHDLHKHFPAAIVETPSKELPPEQQLSWLVPMSMYMVALMDPKWQFDSKKPFDDPANAYVVNNPRYSYYLMCAASPDYAIDWRNTPDLDETKRITHYVGVTGVGKDAAWLARDHPDAGVFGYGRTTKQDDLDAKGASSVMMVIETATANGHWAQGGHGTARGLDLHGAAYLGEHGQFTSFHDGRFLFSRTFTTNVLFADCTVRGFTDETSDRVFESMVTLAGRE